MLTKPTRGAYLLERKQKQQAHKAREKATMQAALVRDGKKCRVPRCGYRSMPVDPCHQRHRGMGGNPKEDRTTVETVIALCRIHHGEYDTGMLEIEPLTAEVFSGPCAFYCPHPETGRLECIGTETRIGVSEMRGL